MSAVVEGTRAPRQLDKPAEPDEQVTEHQVADLPRLARVLMTLLRDVAALKRRWAPHYIDFAGYVFDATGLPTHRFPHPFKGKIRWWVVDWNGAVGHSLSRDTSTTSDTLVLFSVVAGTATLRIEESG